MTETLIPKNIYQDFVNHKINRFEAIKLLNSLIENSDDLDLRVESINLLNKVSKKTYKIFKILENNLISDESDKIRSSAAKSIILNYLEYGYESLKWTILHDTSPLVLSVIGNLLKDKQNDVILKLREDYNKRLDLIAVKYEIVPEEVPFILNLGINIAKNNFFKLGSDLHYIFDDNTILSIKNGHIIELSLSLKSEIPHSIDSLTMVENLDLSSNYLTDLPDSMFKLSELKYINLSWNNFTRFPHVLTKLKSIEFLDVSKNNIKEIPDSIKNLKNLKSFHY